MTIKFAHIQIQGVNVAIFAAGARGGSNSEKLGAVLADLTARARANGLRVDKSALAYRVGSLTEFFGTPDLVRYLSSAGVPRWTHQLSV